jgi:hypothetical protein
MSQLKVQVGQAVQYVGLSDETLAAVVTKINSNGTVNLRVYQDGEVEALLAPNVPQYVDTFEARKLDQAHSFKVLSR